MEMVGLAGDTVMTCATTSALARAEMIAKTAETTRSFAFLFISYLRPLSVRSPCANIVESRAGETNRAEPRINHGETLKSWRGKLSHAGRGEKLSLALLS